MKLIIHLITFIKFAFANNLEYIDQINFMNLSWTLDNNKFGNIKHDLFKKRNGYYRSSEYYPVFDTKFSNMLYQHLPDNYDWRTKGVVGDVKDQGQCGNCWAFSAISSLESQLSILTNINYIFSEQEITHCVKNVDTCCDGCNGEMYAVYDYLSGIEDELNENYSYSATDGFCKSSVPYNVSGYKSIIPNNEHILKYYLFNIGPISVGVNANRDWQLYKNGIYDPETENCPNSNGDIDHGVVIVGYGSDNGLNYWIIRNSWGKDWGENGYIRISRGKNTCGVANSPLFPTINTKL
jgi:C1A family cysteine protease